MPEIDEPPEGGGDGPPSLWWDILLIFGGFAIIGMVLVGQLA